MRSHPGDMAMIEITDISALQQRMKSHHFRDNAIIVIHSMNDSSVIGRSQQILGFTRVSCQGLLAKHMKATFNCCQSHFVMSLRRGRYTDCVEIVEAEHLIKRLAHFVDPVDSSHTLRR
jgi:hypothetical protein